MQAPKPRELDPLVRIGPNSQKSVAICPSCQKRFVEATGIYWEWLKTDMQGRMWDSFLLFCSYTCLLDEFTTPPDIKRFH